MKRCMALLTLLSCIAILSACSNKISLELIDAEAGIVSDKHKVGSMILQEGEQAGKELVPTALYYTFHIKNGGNNLLGDVNKGKGISVQIEPHEKLIAASTEAIGFNMFQPEEYDEMGMGYGYSFDVLEPRKTGEFTLYYELGYEEKTQEVRLVPSKEHLDQLKNNALEATLIVIMDDEEIARFDLSKEE